MLATDLLSWTRNTHPGLHQGCRPLSLHFHPLCRDCSLSLSQLRLPFFLLAPDPTLCCSSQRIGIRAWLSVPASVPPQASLRAADLPSLSSCPASTTSFSGAGDARVKSAKERGIQQSRYSAHDSSSFQSHNATPYAQTHLQEERLRGDRPLHHLDKILRQTLQQIVIRLEVCAMHIGTAISCSYLLRHDDGAVSLGRGALLDTARRLFNIGHRTARACRPTWILTPSLKSMVHLTVASPWLRNSRGQLRHGVAGAC